MTLQVVSWKPKFEVWKKAKEEWLRLRKIQETYFRDKRHCFRNEYHNGSFLSETIPEDNPMERGIPMEGYPELAESVT